jgi:hypothetical protein
MEVHHLSSHGLQQLCRPSSGEGHRAINLSGRTSTATHHQVKRLPQTTRLMSVGFNTVDPERRTLSMEKIEITPTFVMPCHHFRFVSVQQLINASSYPFRSLK